MLTLILTDGGSAFATVDLVLVRCYLLFTACNSLKQTALQRSVGQSVTIAASEASIRRMRVKENGLATYVRASKQEVNASTSRRLISRHMRFASFFVCQFSVKNFSFQLACVCNRKLYGDQQPKSSCLYAN